MAMNPNDPRRDPIDPEVPFSDGVRTPRDIDNRLQVDPELDEGRASGGRIALYGLAILAVLGALFYGLNSSTDNTTASNPTPSSTAQTAPPATSGMNTAPGTTTGATPAPRPAAPMNNNMNNNNTVTPGTTAPAGSK